MAKQIAMLNDHLDPKENSNIAYLPKRVYDVKEDRIIETKSIRRKLSWITISHRWGREHANRRIDGMEWMCRDSDLTKLRNAMKIAREHDIRYLWMDSVCVDQSDQDEMIQEIKKYRSIYLNATCTIAYLDEIREDLEQMIMELIDRINNRRKHYNKIEDGKNCFEEFIRNEWFKRVWTLQEMLISPNLVFVNLRNGKPICTIEDCHKLYRIYVREFDQELKSHSIREVYNYKNTRMMPSLSRVLTMCRDRISTIPEDQAYGISALLDVEIQAKYGIGKEEAFRRLFYNVAIRHGDVSFIEYNKNPNDKWSYMPNVDKIYDSYTIPKEALSIVRRRVKTEILPDGGLCIQVPKPIELTQRCILQFDNNSEKSLFKRFVKAGKKDQNSDSDNEDDIINQLTSSLSKLDDDSIKNLLERYIKTRKNSQITSCYQDMIRSFDSDNVNENELKQLAAHLEKKLDNDKNDLKKEVFEKLYYDRYAMIKDIFDFDESKKDRVFTAKTPNNGVVIGCLHKPNSDKINKITCELYLVNHSYCRNNRELPDLPVVIVEKNTETRRQTIQLDKGEIQEKYYKHHKYQIVGLIKAASREVFDENLEETEWIELQ
jgi:hypothetical protein